MIPPLRKTVTFFSPHKAVDSVTIDTTQRAENAQKIKRNVPAGALVRSSRH